ncbi:hypothetical protein Taro_018547 [Colocasia esculenta]|uniref:Uncharacterized protein n=1 Tax=Colocasia esculenta TaxID=4460 RepID=A0A843URA3_COLES|nr:hypothetical protein [Colocasia esculenta]
MAEEGKARDGRDDLAESLSDLFNSISAMVHGELQVALHAFDPRLFRSLRALRRSCSFVSKLVRNGDRWIIYLSAGVYGTFDTFSPVPRCPGQDFDTMLQRIELVGISRDIFFPGFSCLTMFCLEVGADGRVFVLGADGFTCCTEFNVFCKYLVFTGSNNLLDLLEKMNLRVAEECKSFGDVASGLRVFVEQLNKKNGGFEDHIKRIEAIDQQVTEFEAVVSMLDKYVSLLETRVRSSYQSSSA